jgi:hypothetical protein
MIPRELAEILKRDDVVKYIDSVSIYSCVLFLADFSAVNCQFQCFEKTSSISICGGFISTNGLIS